MRVEDITENHIRRQALVRVKHDDEVITGIPLGFVDKEVRTYAQNKAIWHDRNVCKGTWFVDSLTRETSTVASCDGECIPSQKRPPWGGNNYVLMLHNFVYTDTELRRTVVFSSGREVTYVLETWKEDIDADS